MSMIRILGGASRTGKGLIAQRILETCQIPYFSLDILKMGLVNTVPDFGIDPEASPIEVATRLWPLASAMIVNMIEIGSDYTVEGEILPNQTHELIQTYPGKIKACFIGYRTIRPEQKLAEIRQYAGHPNDWVQGFPDAYVLELVEEAIEFSQRLAQECEALELPYFDTSDDFPGTLDQVVAFLS
jgi:hypothetical protein